MEDCYWLLYCTFFKLHCHLLSLLEYIYLLVQLLMSPCVLEFYDVEFYDDDDVGSCYVKKCKWHCILFTVYVWQSWMKKWRNQIAVYKVRPSLRWLITTLYFDTFSSLCWIVRGTSLSFVETMHFLDIIQKTNLFWIKCE